MNEAEMKDASNSKEDTGTAKTTEKHTRKNKCILHDSDISTDDTVPKRSRQRSRLSKASTSASVDFDVTQTQSTVETQSASANTTGGRVQGRQRNCRDKTHHQCTKNSSTTNINTSDLGSPQNVIDLTEETQGASENTIRGRARGGQRNCRGISTKNSPTSNINTSDLGSPQNVIDLTEETHDASANTIRGRARGWQRNCRGISTGKTSTSDINTPDLGSPQNVIDLTVETQDASADTIRGRARDWQRNCRGISTTNTSTSNINTFDLGYPQIVIDLTEETQNTSNNTNPTSTNTIYTNAVGITPSVRSRNRSENSQRGCGRRGRLPRQSGGQITPPELSTDNGCTSDSIPTYSVGNTDEYPDASYNQPLFSNPPNNDLVESEEINDFSYLNEEISVKVCWRSDKYFTIPVRRYQNLKPVFDFFAEKDNVKHENIIIMYDDKILKMDDTPDSISYNFDKFLEGGVIKKNVFKLVENRPAPAKEGIKLKFQCQNVKRPYETYVKPEDRFAVAMICCAEHLVKPLEKLKFFFDGDVITGKKTPKELDFEGGECIDVKIIN